MANNEENKGLPSGNDIINAGKTTSNIIKNVENSKGYKEVISTIKAILESLFGGLPPELIAGIIGLILVFVIIMLIIVSSNSSTLFSSDATSKEHLSMALKDGYNQTKSDAKEYIADYINSTYGCGGSANSFSSSNGKFTYSTRACEITVDFTPELDEFVEHIDAYANAVNSTLQFFEEDGSKQLTESENTDFSDSLTTTDEDGNAVLSDYGKDVINSYDSEYANNQSEAYFDTLKEYSEDIFDYEKDTSEWIFGTFYKGTKKYPVTKCYRKNYQNVTIDGQKDEYLPCSCTLAHDKEVVEYEEVEALFGSITVPMTYDVTKYKEDALNTCASDIVGQEMFLPTSDNMSEYKKRAIKDEDDANDIIQTILSDYELSYLLSYLGGSYGYGYDGMISSNGWNYLTAIDSKDGEKLALSFWTYSNSLRSELSNLQYASDSYGSSPSMTHQCTQFAATFFYDIYGFSALRGNGNMQAEYLLKDCGINSACPVKFERSATPAPGAIVSLYPNHVIVVDEVSNGKVYISEGNYNGNGAIRTHQEYDSLQDYAKIHGYQIKTIAIPIQEQ